MMHHINPKTAFFLHRTDLRQLANCCYGLCVIRFEGAAPYAVALHLPGKFLTLESGSANEACKKRVVYCTGLDCSLIYT